MSGTNFTIGRLRVGPHACGPLGIGSGASLASASPSFDQRIGMVGAEFGPTGFCPQDPVEHKVITDRSPSLGYGANPGNDPAGLRHLAVWRAAQQVAARCRCGHEHLEVLSFDLTGALDTGRLGFDRAAIKALAQAMSSTDYGFGVSTLAPSLTAARHRLESHDGPATLTILSDFQLTDMATISELDDFPAWVHAVVFTAPVPSELQALADAGDIAVTRVTPTDRAATVALAVYGELTRFRPDQRPPHRARRETH